MTIQDIRIANLKDFIDTKGTAAAIEDAYEGVSASYLSQLINKHRPFGEKAARKFELIFGLQVNSLDQPNVKQERAHYNVMPGPPLSTSCPVISWVQAGSLCENGEIDTFESATEWRDCPVKHSNKTFVLVIVGDSMSPEYLEGWDIFVDPTIDARHNDDVVVCDPQGNSSFKRLQITPEGKYLLALNPEHPQRKIKVPEGTTICGVVIYSGKKRR